MTPIEYLRNILTIPELEYLRQMDRVTKHIGEAIGAGVDNPLYLAQYIINCEHKEVLSSLHISGALHGAIKALEDAERRIAELEAKIEKQRYWYIGKDGKPVLAKDLEDRAEKAEAELAEVATHENLCKDEGCPHHGTDHVCVEGDKR
jgi:hypothetical protein